MLSISVFYRSIDQCSTDLHHGCTPIREFGKKLRCHYGMFSDIISSKALVWYMAWNIYDRFFVYCGCSIIDHDDVIKCNHFPGYWPFVRGIYRLPVNSPQKGQWRGALMFSLIWAWMNVWINNRKASDSRRHRAHYDVTVKFVTPGK